MTVLPFALFFRNTLITTLVPLVGALFSCSLVAYSFARLRWPGRDIWFLVLLATLMLPEQVTMIPRFILFRNLGLDQHLLPLDRAAVIRRRSLQHLLIAAVLYDDLHGDRRAPPRSTGRGCWASTGASCCRSPSRP